MRRRLIALTAILGLVFVGCNGNDDDTNDAGATATAAASPTATPCSLPGGSTQAQRGGTTPPTAPLTDVRFDDEGCPRIAFEFAEQEPAYVVQYAEPPFSECGSGEAVDTDAWEASAYLTVRLEPSGTADLSKEDAPQTYSGRRDIDADGRVLKHLRVICDFEAVLEWVIGLDRRHDFTVVTLDDPSRIVIDIGQT